MKKINSYLKSYVKNIDGNLLGIGITEENILNLIEKNNKIVNCDLLNSNALNKKGKAGKKLKSIPIKKIRKVFGRRKFDYIIANADELKKYFKTFVRDSMYINKKTIYIYVDENYDFSHLETMYKRYNAKIEIEKCSDGFILIINTSNAKDHKIKNKFYYILDFFYEIFDNIGDFLSKY